MKYRKFRDVLGPLSKSLPRVLTSNIRPWLIVVLVGISVIFKGQISHLESGVALLCFRNTEYSKTARENCKRYAKKTSFDLRKNLMHAGGHARPSAMRRRLLKASRKAKKPLIKQLTQKTKTKN